MRSSKLGRGIFVRSVEPALRAAVSAVRRAKVDPSTRTEIMLMATAYAFRCSQELMKRAGEPIDTEQLATLLVLAARNVEEKREASGGTP